MFTQWTIGKHWQMHHKGAVRVSSAFLERVLPIRSSRAVQRLARRQRRPSLPSLQLHLTNTWGRALVYTTSVRGLTSWCLAQEDSTSSGDSSLFVRVFFGGIAIVFFGILFTVITGRMASGVVEDPSNQALLGDIFESPRDRRAKRQQSKPERKQAAEDRSQSQD
jgi:hypothetical protein